MEDWAEYFLSLWLVNNIIQPRHRLVPDWSVILRNLSVTSVLIQSYSSDRSLWKMSVTTTCFLPCTNTCTITVRFKLCTFHVRVSEASWQKITNTRGSPLPHLCVAHELPHLLWEGRRGLLLEGQPRRPVRSQEDNKMLWGIGTDKRGSLQSITPWIFWPILLIICHLTRRRSLLYFGSTGS